MSLLGRLFGGKTLEQERARADALFASGDFGAAKLAYESAEDLAKQAPEATRSELGARVDACCDAIAKHRIEQADTLLARGDIGFAVEELRSAIETAASAAIAREAEARLERLERATVQKQVQDAQPEPEDRFEMLSGGFEEDQYAEYRAHGARVEEALLAMHDGKIKEARALLEDELPKADAPRYLWFELGRVRLADGDSEAGITALHEFLAKLHAEEGGDARLLAHMEIAQVEQAKGDVDAAVKQYEAALEALPHDPRPYLALSAFLRKEGAAEEAIEVVHAGLEAIDESQAQWRMWQELGLAHADAGHDDEAMTWLERVIDFLVARQRVEPPAEGTARLAQLYERHGNVTRAVDLYSILCSGSDVANLCGYHVEAARLMTELGLQRDARRMLQRALELAGEDADLRAVLEAKLAALQS